LEHGSAVARAEVESDPRVAGDQVGQLADVHLDEATSVDDTHRRTVAHGIT